jgi:hypothetical protein
MPKSESIPAASVSGDADASFARWFDSKRTIILSIAVLAAIVWTLLFFSFTADDAFISFRYGKNLVLHHMWNWNPYGTREEAYTSALYTVIAIIPSFLHLPTIIFMKLVGLSCLGVMVYRLITLSSSRMAVLLGLLLITIGPVLWMQIYAGLETPLYMMLILEMAIAVLHAETTPPAWVYTLFLLLPLTRPEGLIFSCAGVLLFWRCRQSSKQVGWFSLALILGVSYFLARWRYFHHPLPNPFYVKVTHESVHDLLGQMFINVAQYKGYLFALALIIWLSKRSVTRILALCSLLLLLLLFAPHEMAMNYGDRYYVQLTLPILFFFLIAENIPGISRFAVAITALFVLAFSPVDILRSIKSPGTLGRAHLNLGHRLEPFAGGHTMIAPDIGGLPYYSNWFTYDFLGLGTNSIAQHGITLASLQQMHPDLIILYSANPGPALLHNDAWVGGTEATGQAFKQYLNQSGQYEYAASSEASNFYLVTFLRKDTPQHDRILAALQQNQATSQVPVSLKRLLLQQYLPSS